MNLTALPLQEPSIKIAVGLKKSTLEVLDSYQACYEETYSQPVTQRELIEAIIVRQIGQDKSFHAWRQAAPAATISAMKKRRNARDDGQSAADAE